MSLNHFFAYTRGHLNCLFAHWNNECRIPLTPSLSPNGGEGARRAGEGALRSIGWWSLVATLLAGMCGNVSAADRIPWTTSRIQGSPEPPKPYVTERVFPRLTLNQGLEMVPIDGRFFVVERRGMVWSFPIRDDVEKADLVIDLKKLHPKEVGSAYGLAFHPDWRKNGHVFLTYAHGYGVEDGTKLSRFKLLPGSPPRLDPASEEIILTWRGGGHNGANLKFGPDGMLYISTGDASEPSPPDILNTGQDNSDLLSSILRIDVNGTSGGARYRIPKDNPYVNVKNVKPEIWAFGFRQPWKMSFDAKGRLWVGEVGWELWEMIHLVKKGGNYGWSAMEASQPIKPETASPLAPISPPVAAHPHHEAASITGGYVYRGKRLPKLRGAYIYGDYETGKIWALWHAGQKVTYHEEIADTPHRISTFGQDEDGELYYIHYEEVATIHRLVPNPRRGKPSAFPRQLSESGLFTNVAKHRLADGVYGYDVIEPMWQDGAVAERFIGLPGKSKVETEVVRAPNDKIRSVTVKWPANAVLGRTVMLSGGKPSSAPVRVETQLLHFDGEMWSGYSYRWNNEGTDAELIDAAGDEVKVPAAGWKGGSRFRIHGRAECVRCHNSWSGYALGFQPEQLAALSVDSKTPIREALNAHGLADENFFVRKSPGQLVASRSDQPIDLRARSWLHANCAHCHRRHGGGAVPLEVNIDQPLAKAALVDVTPTRGQFGIPDGRIVVPGEPDRSVMLYRLAAIGSGHMPIIGARETDTEGVNLLWDWIAGMDAAKKSSTEPSAKTLSSEDGLKAHLSTVNGAMKLARLLDSKGVGKQVRKSIVTTGLNSADANIRALFERFRSPDERPATLGNRIDAKQLLAVRGDAKRGAEILSLKGKWAACYACHRIKDAGNNFGPDLSQVGARLKKEQILESLLQPSKTVAPEYRAWLIETGDEFSFTGFIAKQTADEIELKLATGQTQRIRKPDIRSQKPQALSLMPEGLLQTLTAQEGADVLAWLASLK